jgi:hypothetical protein
LGLVPVSDWEFVLLAGHDFLVYVGFAQCIDVRFVSRRVAQLAQAQGY